MLLISGILFYSGVVYVDKLIDFLDKIDNSIVQKETFYVLVLEDDRTKDINELLNKKIGYYNSASAKENNGKAFKMLDKKITYDKKEYENIEDLLNENKKFPSVEIIKYLENNDINLKIYSDDNHNILNIE